jgi:TM2 domain-containing membrane protein YozV
MAETSQKSDKSKVAAGILGIFLGVFGVHNFYLGNTGKAVAQLLISILSLGLLAWASAIWGLVEGILILCSKPGTQWHKDAEGKELQD